jgi:hypothetical protein
VPGQPSAGRRRARRVPASTLTASRMLTIATELDLLASLLAMLAAVLAERSLRLDDAITGRVGTFGGAGHGCTSGVERTLRLRQSPDKLRLGIAIRAGAHAQVLGPANRCFSNGPAKSQCIDP